MQDPGVVVEGLVKLALVRHAHKIPAGTVKGGPSPLRQAARTWPVPGVEELGADHPALRASAQWVDIPARV